MNLLHHYSLHVCKCSVTTKLCDVMHAHTRTHTNAQLEKVTNEGTLQQLLLEDKYSVVFDCGFSTPINQVTLNDIPLIIS